MDKSHKVSGADGGVWSYSSSILNGEHVKCNGKQLIKDLAIIFMGYLSIHYI